MSYKVDRDVRRSIDAIIAKLILPIVFLLCVVFMFFLNYQDPEILHDESWHDVIKFYVINITPEVIGTVLVAIILYFIYDPIINDITGRLERKSDYIPRSSRKGVSGILSYYLYDDSTTLDYVALCFGGDVIAEHYHTVIEDRVEKYSLKENFHEEDIGLASKEVMANFANYARMHGELITQMNLQLKNLEQGDLERLWIDVHSGGLVTLVLSSGNPQEQDEKNHDILYLFGATLDQLAMDDGSALRQLKQIGNELMQSRSVQKEIASRNEKSA